MKNHNSGQPTFTVTWTKFRTALKYTFSLNVWTGENELLYNTYDFPTLGNVIVWVGALDPNPLHFYYILKLLEISYHNKAVIHFIFILEANILSTW